MTKIVRIILLIILIGLLVNKADAQVVYTPIDFKLETNKVNNTNELICSSSTLIVKFQFKRELSVLNESNLISIDDQAIQIVPLKFSGPKNDTISDTLNSHKALLDKYSKYELDYYKNDLGISVINLNHQWVVTKSRGWYIWYFKVGNTKLVENQTQIQLFASTVIGDNIFTINAPILIGGDFAKAGTIVNDMMEAITIMKQ